MLDSCGFTPAPKGKTGGSRRKFHNEKTGVIFAMHQPHPQPTLKSYAVDQLLDFLVEGGYIDA